jgi:hypothetical protein
MAVFLRSPAGRRVRRPRRVPRPQAADPPWRCHRRPPSRGREGSSQRVTTPESYVRSAGREARPRATRRTHQTRRQKEIHPEAAARVPPEYRRGEDRAPDGRCRSPLQDSPPRSRSRVLSAGSRPRRPPARPRRAPPGHTHREASTPPGFGFCLISSGLGAKLRCRAETPLQGAPGSRDWIVGKRTHDEPIAEILQTHGGCRPPAANGSRKRDLASPGDLVPLHDSTVPYCRTTTALSSGIYMARVAKQCSLYPSPSSSINRSTSARRSRIADSSASSWRSASE